MLALLGPSDNDLTPAEGESPPEGIAKLSRTSTPDEALTPAVVLLSATLRNGVVALLLHTPLASDAALERYDVTADQWRRSATLPAGSDHYEVDPAAAPTGGTVRVLLGDETSSNSVFVADLDRVRRPHVRAIGKARATPAEIARLGLGNQLLADLDELRPHLLRVGASIAQPARPMAARKQRTTQIHPLGSPHLASRWRTISPHAIRCSASAPPSSRSYCPRCRASAAHSTTR